MTNESAQLPSSLPEAYQRDPTVRRAYQMFRADLEARSAWRGEESDDFFVMATLATYRSHEQPPTAKTDTPA